MATNNRKIVVIEDDKPIRWILGLLLEGHGYDVTLASTAAEGLLAVAQQEPALVVLDLILSVGWPNGFTLVEPIKKLGAKVVIVSAFVSRLTNEQRTQVAGILSKPFDVDELIKLCEDAAPLKGWIGYCRTCHYHINVGETYTNTSGRLECKRCSTRRIQTQSEVDA